MLLKETTAPLLLGSKLVRGSSSSVYLVLMISNSILTSLTCYSIMYCIHYPFLSCGRVVAKSFFDNCRTLK